LPLAGLGVVVLVWATLAFQSVGVLMASEIITGRSKMTMVRCTYVVGLRSATLQFVRTPEGTATCKLLQRVR
jgi:hypothetical protein